MPQIQLTEQQQQQQQTSLPPIVGFSDLLHPSNPIVFLDIATESAFGKAKPLPTEKGRVFVELFANWSPLMAENFRQLCTGEARKGGGGGGHSNSTPVGYKGSFLYSAVPGRDVVGGDVVRGDGMGGPFSIYGCTNSSNNKDSSGLSPSSLTSSSLAVASTPNGPFLADNLVSNATKRELLNNHPGLVRMVPSVISASGGSGGGNGSVGVPAVSVGSAFSLVCVPPAELPQTWTDDHWTTVVGRIISRVTMTAAEGSSNNSTTTNNNAGGGGASANSVPDALKLLDKCGRDIYQARRDANRASNTSGLPIVGQCGEM